MELLKPPATPIEPEILKDVLRKVEGITSADILQAVSNIKAPSKPPEVQVRVPEVKAPSVKPPEVQLPVPEVKAAQRNPFKPPEVPARPVMPILNLALPPPVRPPASVIPQEAQAALDFYKTIDQVFSTIRQPDQDAIANRDAVVSACLGRIAKALKP